GAREMARAKGREPEAELWRSIEENEHLADLLVSEAGKEWLDDEAVRLSVENFLALEREDQDSREWVRATTEQALDQIQSDDRREIVAGCHTLSQLDSTLR